MAYVLGFFAADGTMIRNNRGAHFVEFHVTDKQILKQIQEALGSNHKIGLRIRDRKWKPGYRLQVGSKLLFKDLTTLGFTPNKSLTLSLPPIPKKCVSAFVRGYFDGDGNVYFKRHLVKGRKKPKWIFSSRFTSGSRRFLEDLQSMLHKHGLAKGFIIENQRGFELVFSHHDSVALYSLMYDNNPRIYLKRKYKLFRKALMTLYGSTMRP
ncbi:MAG: LAGLIDADG family homing endonuclease [Candidatus Paceibacterota bacterium]